MAVASQIMGNTGFPESGRLVFRAWAESDLPLARSLWTDAGVMGHMGGPMSEEEVRARLALEIERQETLGVQYWPMFVRTAGIPGEFAGCAGLRPWHDEAGVFELGVHVARRFWSERMGEAAARAVIQYAFGTLGVQALTAGHGPNNVNSKALIERLGFRYTHEEPWGRRHTLHPFYRLNRRTIERRSIVFSSPLGGPDDRPQELIVVSSAVVKTTSLPQASPAGLARLHQEPADETA